jgi:two-component system, OmpR family, KDP operon response regulator KdpE
MIETANDPHKSPVGHTLVAVVVEDDPQIRRFVRLALETEGWLVSEADTVRQGLIECATRKPNIVIVDLGLPDGDGATLVREVRAWSSVPIVVLSARTDEQQKVDALDAGADDYLTKPFSIAELLARLRAHLRRSATADDSGRSQFSFGDVTVELSTRTVLRAGDAVRLTPIEYRLLTTLISNAGRVVTQRQLLNEVWGPGYAERSHYLRIHMGHLRHKLERDPAQPEYLLTELGVGYRLSVR